MKDFLTSYRSILTCLVLTFSAGVIGCGYLPAIRSSANQVKQVTEKKSPASAETPIVQDLRPIVQSARQFPVGSMILDLLALLAGTVGSSAAVIMKKQQASAHSAIRELSGLVPPTATISPATKIRVAKAQSET